MKDISVFFIVLCFLFSALEGNSQAVSENSEPFFPEAPLLDSAANPDSLLWSDSVQIRDTLEEKSGAIDDIIEYKSDDSVVFDLASDQMYLYGKSQIQYTNLTLNAEEIKVDMKKNEVDAYGKADSTGGDYGLPIFKEGDKEYRSEYMKYNLKTKMGQIQNVRTQENDGYIFGEKVQKDSTNIVYIKHGSFTTCEADHPHFYIQANKLKIIPQKSIYTSWATLYVNDKATFLNVPFGIFPNSAGRRSGILMPTYGESESKGIFLNGFGAYILVGKNLDFSSRWDYFFKTRDYATTNTVNYVKKYKYTGGLTFSLSRTSSSFKELPDFTESKNYLFAWNHSQDRNANPYTTFSASVNFATSDYYRNTYTTSTQDYVKSNFSSSISLSHRVPNRPINYSLGLRQSGNVESKELNLTLPQFQFSVNRINPLKRKQKKGKEKWYEKIQTSYKLDLRNEIKTKDSLLFDAKTYEYLKAGAQHTIPISTSLKLLKYFSLTPSVNYKEVWYPNSIERQYVRETNKVVTDTLNRFKSWRTYNFSTSFTTRIYGTVLFKKGALKGIRHTLTPTLGFTYTPEFGKEKYGYYKTVPTDTTGEKFQTYSVFTNGIFGSPSKDKSAVLSIGIGNNLEFKVKNKKATSEKDQYKKVKLFDQLNISTGYDFEKDSLNWSDMSIRTRTSLFKLINISYSAAYSFYATDSLGTVQNRYHFDKTGYIARYVRDRLSAAFSYSISSKKLNKNAHTHKPENPHQKSLDPIVTHRYGIQNVDFSIPWSFDFSYNFNLTGDASRGKKVSTIQQTLSFRGDVNVTPKWKVNFSSGYNFKEKGITITNFNISRDLHCWVMTLALIPFGSRQSYTFNLRVKAQTLADLKVNRNNFWYDR